MGLNRSELHYIKTTIEWIDKNTELIDHNRTQQETIYNSVCNSINLIEGAMAELNIEAKAKLNIPIVVFSEAELKAKLDEQKEEHRQWLEGEGYELLAERL